MISRFSAVFAVVAVASISGCAGAANDDTQTTTDDLSSDKCVTPARNAAEAEYGNDPDGTKVVALTKGKKYRVTVGIKNAEDGAHDYYVTFPSGCSSKPSVMDVPFIANPLRDAAHATYGKLLADNGDALPSSAAITVSHLPSAAHSQYETYKTSSACTAVHAYEIEVSGENTFAVVCDVKDDSIIHDIVIWDSSDDEVDQASVYGSKDVGDNGVSWQNDTFEVQD
jgi:hypothetical protein